MNNDGAEVDTLGPYAADIRKHSAVVKVPSETDARIVYNVVITAHFASCGCKGYVYRGHCHHVDAVMELIDVSTIADVEGD